MGKQLFEYYIHMDEKGNNPHNEETTFGLNRHCSQSVRITPVTGKPLNHQNLLKLYEKNNPYNGETTT